MNALTKSAGLWALVMLALGLVLLALRKLTS